MIVKINDRVFRVKFRHRRPVPKPLISNYPAGITDPSPPDRGGTDCIIEREVQGGGLEVVATGSADVYYKDQFCKEAGRKASLTKALNYGRTVVYTIEGGALSLLDDGVFNYNHRKLIWNTYFNRKTVKTNESVEG